MKKLMIVDDEELMRQKLETLVDYSLLGLQLVAQARDGSEGERLILTHQPDVVITDVVMPGKNGLEMIASLQGKTQAKFIILSGYQDFDYVREALRLGAADYVLKPVQAPELKRTLERVLAVQPQEEEDDHRRYGESRIHGDYPGPGRAAGGRSDLPGSSGTRPRRDLRHPGSGAGLRLPGYLNHHSERSDRCPGRKARDGGIPGVSSRLS